MISASLYASNNNQQKKIFGYKFLCPLWLVVRQLVHQPFGPLLFDIELNYLILSTGLNSLLELKAERLRF
jgi:hypothetical protein